MQGPLVALALVVQSDRADLAIAALDVASIALLGVKWAAKKIDQLERRIAALEGRHGS